MVYVMRIVYRKFLGGIFLALGLLLIVCSPWIVFPGLERLLGIENLVGRENVIYRSDGSYIFTNPGAMTGWIGLVTGVGLLLILLGAFLLMTAFFRYTNNRPKQPENKSVSM